MKRNIFKIAIMVAALAMALSLTSFAAVGDSVPNVFLNKEAVDVTAKYYKIDDYITYSEWAETVGSLNCKLPKFAVDGRYDDWSDQSGWVVANKSDSVNNLPGGVLEIDLDGYFSLETLDIYHVWGTQWTGSDIEETTIQVSVDGGKHWTDVISKQALDHDTVINLLDSDTSLGIVKSTFNLNGAVANKVRFIFEDTDVNTVGFHIQELQCNGKVAEKPATTPDTFDGLTIAVAAMALGAFGVAVSKKRR